MTDVCFLINIWLRLAIASFDPPDSSISAGFWICGGGGGGGGLGEERHILLLLLSGLAGLGAFKAAGDSASTRLLTSSRCIGRNATGDTHSH